MKKLLSICITIALLFPLLYHEDVSAADFNIDIDLTYAVDKSGTMHITEKRTLNNNSKLYYIKKGSPETFYINSFKTRSEDTRRELEKVKKTISLTDAVGNDISFDAAIKNDQIEVAMKLPSNLDAQRSLTYILSYDNFELAEKSGNVWNIYIPGISEGYEKTVTSPNGATTQSSYTVSLELSNSLGEPNFVLPQAARSESTNGKSIYVFKTKDLEERSVWIQIGKKQYYSFNITQPVSTPTGTTSRIFNTWYELILPRDSANQEVFFSSISPEPDYIKTDGEGNVITRFTLSDEQISEITVEGIIVTSITDPVAKDDVGTIGSIDLDKTYSEVESSQKTFEDLLSEQQYWEVDAKEIQETAENLKGEEENVYEILLNNYQFVTDNVDYDNLKVELLNERKGALSTLQGGSSVCMEYSDLLITLLRAQGIPSRAAFGYGFDPRAESAEQEGHQWVEVYMPNVGWVAVDPTWGDTGRRDYIGGDVDHALWYVAGTDVNTPSPIVKYSIGDVGELAAPQFEMNVQEKIDTEDLMSLAEVLEQYPYSPTDSIQERIDQLNVYGRILFLGIPGVLVVLIVLTTGIAIIRRIQKRRRKNFVHAGPAGHNVPPENPYY